MTYQCPFTVTFKFCVSLMWSYRIQRLVGLIYDERVRNSAPPPLQARCEVDCNRQFGPGLVWKDVWKDVSSSWNDLLLRDFDWRMVHGFMHQWFMHQAVHSVEHGLKLWTTHWFIAL